MKMQRIKDKRKDKNSKQNFLIKKIEEKKKFQPYNTLVIN